MGAFEVGDKVRFQIFVSGDYIGRPRWNVNTDYHIKYYPKEKLDWVEAEVVRFRDDFVDTKYVDPFNKSKREWGWLNKEHPEREGYIQHANRAEKITTIQPPIDMSDLIERVYIKGCGSSEKARKWAVEQFAPVVKRRVCVWPKCECGCFLELDADHTEEGNEWVLRPVFKCKCKE